MHLLAQEMSYTCCVESQDLMPMPPENDFEFVDPEPCKQVEVLAPSEPTPADKVLSFFDPSQKDPRAYHGPAIRATSSTTVYQQAPHKPPPVHAHANFCAFALYPGGSLTEGIGDVKITGETPAGQLNLSLPLPPAAVKRSQPLVHRMAARALIRDLENGDCIEAGSVSSDLAVHLSLRFNVLCQSTAFVAVDTQDSTHHHMKLIKRVVPQQFTHYSHQLLMRGASLDALSTQSANLSLSATQFYTQSARLTKMPSFGIGSLTSSVGRTLSSLFTRKKNQECAAYPTSRLSSSGVPEPPGFCKMLVSPPATEANPAKDESRKLKEKMGSAATAAGEYADKDSSKLKKARPDWSLASDEADFCNNTQTDVQQAYSRMDKLKRLLCLSAANGSFVPSEAVLALMCVSEAAISVWAAAWGDADRQPSSRILVTALVLAYLRREFPNEKSTWGLLAEKSTQWLGKQENDWKNTATEDVEALIMVAAGLLP